MTNLNADSVIILEPLYCAMDMYFLIIRCLPPVEVHYSFESILTKTANIIIAEHLHVRIVFVSMFAFVDS